MNTVTDHEEGLLRAALRVDVISKTGNAKTEDGLIFPREAYAYTGDPDLPSTWKLRLWETPQTKATIAQLGRAAAAFSPGGFRGRKVQLLPDAMAGAKARIRSEYKKLGVDPEDVPASVAA